MDTRPAGVTRREVDEDFSTFVSEVEPRLRRAFVAFYGPERDRDATAEALAWAWAHWDEARAMENPAGYLFRVGQSRTRPLRRPVVFPDPPAAEPWIEPALGRALSGLSEGQRLAVVLVHGFGWTYREVAELGGVSLSTVQTHLERGLAKLRAALGSEADDART